jgi:hypothetical protein
MMSDRWCVAVFKCKPENIRSILVDFYRFVKDLDGVRSIHFLIRDRVEDEIVVTFRVLTERENKQIIASKMSYKLGSLIPTKFAVDPDVRNPLSKYVPWSSEDRIAKLDPKRFTQFCNLLSKMSKLVIQMLGNRYFDSDARVELAHAMSWMLGCTEYGILSTTHMEVGYYDRIEDKYLQYLNQDFPKQ